MPNWVCSETFLSRDPPPLCIHWPLTTGHWPLFSCHSPLATCHSPLATRHYLLRPDPSGYCHPPTSELGKSERDPISTSGPSLYIVTPECSMLPNQAVSSDKSIRFCPRAAARSLTIRGGPQALDANAPERPPTFPLQGNVCCRFRLRALDCSYISNTSLDG